MHEFLVMVLDTCCRSRVWSGDVQSARGMLEELGNAPENFSKCP